MLNTYKSGQIFYAAKLFPVHVGDVVVASVFDEEEGRNINVIKRVIAKGGDSVAIIGGKIIINGQPYFDEFTRQDDFIYSLAPQLLEEDQVFIIGDNRSITQHYIISREQIIGKSLF